MKSMISGKSQKSGTKSLRSTTRSGTSGNHCSWDKSVEKPPLRWDDERRRLLRNAKPKIAYKPPPPLPYGNLMRPNLMEKIANETQTLHQMNLSLVDKFVYTHVVGGKTRPFTVHSELPKTSYHKRKEHAKTIEIHNQMFFENLKTIGPKVQEVGELNKEWEETKRDIALRSKFPVRKMPKIKLIDHVCGKRRAICITPLVTEKSAKYPDKRPRVVIEMSHEQFGVIGKMTVMLYADFVPRTCQNFLGFCEQNVPTSTYENCEIFRIFPKYYCITGDVVYNNGLGGETIFGTFLENENFSLKHKEAGVLSMFSVKPNKNMSQFLITFRPLPSLDGKFVAFGKIIANRDLLLTQIETYGTPKSGYPKKRLWISKIFEI